MSQPLFRASALAAPLQRLDVGGLTAKSPAIASYAKAVKAMQALPSSDPTSWAYQAAIHWTKLKPSQASWDRGEHGTEFFWSWHRMYLYWFERIVRHKSGDPTWTLPFWAWDLPGERQLPPMFRDPLSVLHTVNRNASMNGGGSLAPSTVNTSFAFATKVFSTPAGTGANDVFQGTPYGAVNGAIGGWMCCLPTAALDPIFYLHHANCDRLWQVWRAGYGGVDPTTDRTWTGKTYTFFDEFGKPVTMSDCQIVNAAAQLNYVYAGVPALTPEVCPSLSSPACCIPSWITLSELRRIPPLGPATVRVPLPIFSEQRRRLTEIAASSTQAAYLHLAGVEASTQPGVAWAVFVAPPATPTVPADEELSSQNPHYVGNVVLFGRGVRDEMPNAFTPAQFAFRLNRALLASRNAQSLEATFVPQSLVEGDELRIQARVQIVKAAMLVETLKTAKS